MIESAEPSLEPSPAPPLLEPAGLGFWRAIGLTLAVQLGQGAFVAAVFIIVMLIKGRPEGPPEIPVLALSGAALIGGALAIFLGWRWSGLPWRRVVPLHVTRAQVLPGLLLALGGMFVISEFANVLVAYVPLPASWVEGSSVDALNLSPLELVVAAVVIAPWVEETFFRGVLVRRLNVRYGARTAMMGSALLFGISHVYPVQAAATTVMGLGAAWIFLRTGSLAIPIAAHMFNNAANAVFRLIEIDVPGFSGKPVAGELHLQPWWLDAVAIAFVAYGIVGLARATRGKPDL